jgi:RIO-like serine/threonine protein kinase
MDAGGCIDDEEVEPFVAGTLPADTAARLRGHLAGCDDCRELVASLMRDSQLAHQSTLDGSRRALDERTLPLSRDALAYARGGTIGRYVTLEILGRGGMGVVYRAYDPELDRRVALKLVRANSKQQSALRQRLVREAQAMARVSHRNVLTVYDAGTVGDEVYIAMALVEGGTLRQWLRAAPRSRRQILDSFIAAGQGLQAAHNTGIVHRDFKPDNVLVDGDSGASASRLIDGRARPKSVT